MKDKENKKQSYKNFIFCVCMYKMVVEITKETWEKCGIKTVKHYNEKENIIESWQTMSDDEIQLGNSHIANVPLKRIRKYFGKKQKTLQKNKKKNTKHFLKMKELFLLLKSLHVI